jgi:hypothetical protein
LAASVTAVATAPLLTVLYAWRVEPHWLEIVRRDLPIRGLHTDLQGRTLVHVSDLHIGPFVDDAYIVHSFERVAALRPDFVVVTGDFITYRSSAQFDQLEHVLQSLPHGRLGTIASLGNHDYGPGWSQPDIADRVTVIASAAGVTMLRNDATVLSGLQVAGFDDLWANRFAPEPVLEALEPGLPTIALSHNPDTADDPRWGRFSGWILAGHTHGGQCKPPFLPPPLLPVRNKRYTAGEFALTGGRRMYISRGVGHLTRVRFNVRPEVTAFRLTRAA